MKLTSRIAYGSVFLVATVCAGKAEVRLANIFGDHMVLQQEKTIPVWGTADPGEAIIVKFGQEKATTKADKQGHWRVDLKPVPAGSPATELTVMGTNTIKLTDVLIGDVWIASGQSNMEFGVGNSFQGTALIASADEPEIRIYNVPHQASVTPASDVPIATGKDADYQTRWLVCTPESIAKAGNWNGFSAVAFYFGREIQRYTHHPVGLIQSTWGGTPAQAWTSIEGLHKEPILNAYASQHDQRVAGYAAAMANLPAAQLDFEAKAAAWDRDIKPKYDAAYKVWNPLNAEAAAQGKPEPPRPNIPGRPGPPDPTGGATNANLWNGMISPLVPFAIKGVIWYQGEANATRGVEYRTLFPRMITDWREHWKQGEFPFIYVQLADYKEDYNLLREAQSATLKLPETGMAVAIDVGSRDDIHPHFKEPVGHRLALAAEHAAYGSSEEYSGPMYKDMKIENGGIRVRFDHASGLKIGGYPVTGIHYQPLPTDRISGFAIAGEDRQWHEASATVDGDSVVVSSPEVSHPVAVRYGWAPPYPVCNLYNEADLPASPFRTDEWPAK